MTTKPIPERCGFGGAHHLSFEKNTISILAVFYPCLHIVFAGLLDT